MSEQIQEFENFLREWLTEDFANGLGMEHLVLFRDQVQILINHHTERLALYKGTADEFSAVPVVKAKLLDTAKEAQQAIDEWQAKWNRINLRITLMEKFDILKKKHKDDEEGEGGDGSSAGDGTLSIYII